jgi:RNA polymerase-binding transcription factor DksA
MKTASTRPRSRPARHPVPAKWAWHYRTLLGLRAHLLGHKAERLAEPFEAMEPPGLHCADMLEDLYDRSLAEALPADPGEARAEIEAAIKRVASGKYGRCEATGRPIPPRLLRAMPWRRTAAG